MADRVREPRVRHRTPAPGALWHAHARTNRRRIRREGDIGWARAIGGDGLEGGEAACFAGAAAPEHARTVKAHLERWCHEEHRAGRGDRPVTLLEFDVNILVSAAAHLVLAGLAGGLCWEQPRGKGRAVVASRLAREECALRLDHRSRRRGRAPACDARSPHSRPKLRKP